MRIKLSIHGANLHHSYFVGRVTTDIPHEEKEVGVWSIDCSKARQDSTDGDSDDTNARHAPLN